jgi:tRNA A37 methylthiotransferase MiaB
MNIFFVSLGCDKNLVDSEVMDFWMRKDTRLLMMRHRQMLW